MKQALVVGMSFQKEEMRRVQDSNSECVWGKVRTVWARELPTVELLQNMAGQCPAAPSQLLSHSSHPIAGRPSPLRTHPGGDVLAFGCRAWNGLGEWNGNLESGESIFCSQAGGC